MFILLIYRIGKTVLKKLGISCKIKTLAREVYESGTIESNETHVLLLPTGCATGYQYWANRLHRSLRQYRQSDGSFLDTGPKQKVAIC